MLKVKVWDCDKSCDNGWAHHLLLLVGVSLPDDFLLPPIVKHIKMQFGTIQQISDEILKYILSSTSAWLLQEIWILGVKRATRWKKSSTRKGKVRDNKSSRSDSFMFPKFRIGHVVTSLLFELLMALLRFSDSSGKGVFVCSTFSLPFICQTISC